MHARHLVLSIGLALGAASAACSTPTPGTPVPTPDTGTVAPTAAASRKVFVSHEVERGVIQILTEEYKISDVGAVTCPDGRAVEPRTSFVCTVEVGGKPKSVEIVVKSADGEYEVGQPR